MKLSYISLLTDSSLSLAQFRWQTVYHMVMSQQPATCKQFHSQGKTCKLLAISLENW